MAEQRRIGFHWHLRRVMAAHNLWKSTELRPLLLEAKRLREVEGLTWDECAAACRAQGFTGRSGGRLSSAGLYLAYRRHGGAHL